MPNMENEHITLTTVAQVIAAFGGPAQMARDLGLTQQAVSNMKRRGWIPGRHTIKILRLAAARGLPPIADEVFCEASE
jgi:DNA-binding phage protein